MEKKPEDFDKLTDAEFDKLIYAALEQHENAIERELMEQSRDLDTTELQKRILRNIKKEQRKQNAINTLHSAVQLYKNIAALIIFVVATGALFIGSVGAARDTVFTWIADVTIERFRLNESVSTRMPDESKDVLLFPEDWHDFYAPARLPAGFRLAFHYTGSLQKTIIYQNSFDKKVVFIQGERVETFFVGDNENAETDEISVSGYSAIITKKDGLISLFWRTEERAFGLNGNVTLSELIQIAESLRKIE